MKILINNKPVVVDTSAATPRSIQVKPNDVFSIDKKLLAKTKTD